MRELIVDNFAGGGGASKGMEMATGRSVNIAINHNRIAIAMHKVNHPYTRHYIENIWNVDPVKVCDGHVVKLAWFSPDCRYFSKAKGGRPVGESVRGLAWVVLKWVLSVEVEVFMLENVEEFRSWGPLMQDEKGNFFPDPARRGESFNGFIRMLTTGIESDHSAFLEACKFLNIETDSKEAKRLIKGLQYDIDNRELRACDYGAPTLRKRFFLIGRKDGKPIKWPEITYGNPEQIEVRCGLLKPWRTAGEIIDWSIPMESIFDRKTPLKDNTLIKIARGIKKFIIDVEQPYIVDNQAYFLQHYYTHRGKETRASGLNEPLPTISTANRFALVSAFILQQYKNSIGHELDKPLWTTTTVNKSNLVAAFLTKYYGSDIGQSLHDPLHTITTKDRFGLITVHGQKYQITDIRMRMLQPRELFAAQGFPKNYIIDRDMYGNKIPKTQQVKMCGNSVSPVIPEALVRANLPELCEGTDCMERMA